MAAGCDCGECTLIRETWGSVEVWSEMQRTADLEPEPS